MKLFSLYLKFTLQNAIRFPKQAFKILPGLAMLLIGFIWTIIQITTAETLYTGFRLEAVLIPSCILFFFIGTVLYSLFAKRAIISARASDVNFLMPAPMTPFQLNIFMEFKNSLGLVGLLFLVIPAYGSSIIPLLPHPILIIPLFASTLLPLYALSFVHYISATSYRKVGHYLRWITTALCIAFVALIFTLNAQIGLYNAALSPFLQGFPILGWNIGLMVAIATGNTLVALFFTSILVISIVVAYYWAKSNTYNYYEEELMHVQKTEQAYKRAYGGDRIELKAKFIKSNRQLTGQGEKALLDIAWLREGKLWFLLPGLWIKIAIISIVTGFGYQILSQNATKQFLPMVMVYFGITSYSRLFSANAKNDALLTDVYVALMPIKAIYKLLYPLVVRFARLLISTIVLTIIVAILQQFMFEHIAFDFTLYIFILTLSIELMDLVRCYLFQPLLINRFLGAFIRNIVEFLVIGATSALIILPVVFLDKTLAMVLSILITLALTGLFLLFSIISYNHVEKNQKA